MVQFYAMKILSLPLLALLYCCSSPEKTGIVYAGRFELLNKTALSERWNAIVLKNGFNVALTTFKIRKDRDPETREAYYYLFAEAPDNSVKMAALLVRKKNYFYLAPNPELVICHSCIEGRPQRVHGKWYCEQPTAESDCGETIVAGK